MTTWDDELFVHSYTWRRPPTSYAFLGNGRLSAFFDFSGIAQPDGSCYRPIRRQEKVMGLLNLEVGLAKVPLSVRDEALGYALKLAKEMIRGNI